MRIFAQKPNALQQITSAKSTVPGRARFGQSHQVNAILHLQRTIGNQAIERLLRAENESFEAHSGTQETTRFPRDFSQVSIPSQAPALLQPKRTLNSAPVEECNVGEGRVPPVVREVLSSPGQPLDSTTRRFMEPRFGHDFSRVRVHRDSGAAQSTDAVNARAYAVGNDIVFGRGEWAPGTAQGRSLIAHELAHVVQQRNAIDSQPVLRRAAKTAKTWAGEFSADPYDAFIQQGQSDVTVGYGADITLKFKANERVDAEKIAFVQTALGVKDGKPHNKYDQDEKKKKELAQSRMIPSGKPGAGVHIDQSLDVRTPLYGMTGSRGEDLADPEPAKKLTEIGWHYTDAGGKPQNHDAMLHDEPTLSSGDFYTGATDGEPRVAPGVRNNGTRDRRQPEGDVLRLSGMGMEEERFGPATPSHGVQDQI